MDFSTVNQVTSQSTAAAAAAETGSSAASQSAGDFDTFLKMLTTQAQNQDPFNPVDATEYASQLASFSAVEQQVLTNELLSQIAGLANDGGFERLASWIGLEAQTPGAAYYEGSAIAFAFDTIEDSGSAALVLRDASGVERNRIPLAAGSEGYSWDGADGSGAQLPSGVYTATIEVFRDGVLAETLSASSYMRIDEVSRDDGGLLLTLRSGATVAASEVTALRRPEG